MAETEYSGKLNERKMLELLASERNLAETIDGTELAKLETDCRELFEKDDSTCTEWRKDAKKLIEMAKLKDKSREHIQPWQSDLQLPDLIYAAMQFNARTYPEYVKDGKACKTKINGEINDKKQARADRVAAHINYQLTQEITEWPENFDKLLLILPIVGHVFKLTVWDDQLGRITDTILMPDMVTVDNTPNNPDWQRRISITMVVNQNTYKSYVAAGKWRDIEIRQDEGTDADKKYTIVCMHMWYDLDGDGYQEPYTLTFCKNDWKLLAIDPRFDTDSFVYSANPKDPDNDRTLIGIEPVNYVTSYYYFPSPDGSALGWGIGHIIQGMTKARNASINQISDAGTKINLSSGFVRQGLFRDDGDIYLAPGEFKVADGTMDVQDIQKSIYSMPVNAPASSTFEVFGVLGDYVSRISSTGEIMSGENAPANMPATTVLALIEQGKIGQRVVLKRINISLTNEFQIIYRLNRAYLSDKKYVTVNDKPEAIASEDYAENDLDIFPVADPMMSSKAERIMRSQATMSAGIQSPIVVRNYLIDLGYEPKEADEIAQGDSQVKAAQQQAVAQAELMKQQKDLLAQQERTSSANLKEIQARIQLAETESRILLQRAQAIETMAKAQQLADETQIARSNALLEQMANLPAAVPTMEELNDDNAEGEQGGLPAMAGQSGDAGDVTEPANGEVQNGQPVEPGYESEPAGGDDGHLQAPGDTGGDQPSPQLGGIETGDMPQGG